MPKFSPRKCKICSLDIPAPIFGKHIFSHPENELATWPGGMEDLLCTLKESLQLSIVEAQGFPEIQVQLRASMHYIEELKDQLPRPNG